MASSIFASLLSRSLRRYLPSAPSIPGRRFLLTSSFSAASSRGAMLQDPKPPPSLLCYRFASSKVSGDDNLQRVIDSEIQCAQEAHISGQDIDIPEDFPFEIIDNPGDQAIFLKRDFAGENIQVVVLMNLDEQNDVEENDEDDKDEDGNENSMEPSLSLVVTIDKGEDHLLEFCCSLNLDKVGIETMVLKKRDDPDDQSAYQGPEFSDLDENLQKAMHKYLEERGIKSSLFDFLHEYMLNKDEKEYLVWLKSMKEFIA
ncbi:uncharacterized protein At2g39795, mitochondrial-like [Curcuma longa]|uniref:uncharacterized protein At2g39795, mitochondrial-like n=1 Tax=Curcuma longa TaxID=136217 RepID=UPI003D9E9FAE